MSKPHLSASQIDMACKCGEAYRRRYVLGEKIPPRLAMLRGRGVHKGVEENFKQKILSHADLQPKEVADIAVDAFNTDLADGYELTKHDKELSNPIRVYQREVAITVKAHITRQAPEYIPVKVEDKFSVTLADSNYDLWGVKDLKDVKGRITDFKFGAKKKVTQLDVINSTQLTCYAASEVVEGQLPPIPVRLDQLVSTKRDGIVRVVRDCERGVEEIRALRNRIDTVEAIIQAELFAPALPGSWWCSPEWCGYWSTCPYVNSKRRAVHDEAQQLQQMLVQLKGKKK